jgi:hypothetical protein
MALPEYIGASFDGPISAVRRQTIAIVIAVASAIGAIFYGLSAATLALEPQMGTIYARLIIAGAFVVLGAVAVLIPRLFRRQGIAERAKAEADAMTREQKVAMIIEALLLGFFMSSRRPQDSHGRK